MPPKNLPKECTGKPSCENAEMPNVATGANAYIAYSAYIAYIAYIAPGH